MVHLTTALDAASGVPLYEQLYRSLAAEMRTGASSAGTRMPGQRRLAAELSVSVNTVDAAYQLLAAEGYLESRERSGFYVQEYLALPQAAAPEAAPPPRQPQPQPPAPPVLTVRFLPYVSGRGRGWGLSYSATLVTTALGRAHCQAMRKVFSVPATSSTTSAPP